MQGKVIMSRTKKSRTTGNAGEKFNGQRKETSTQAKSSRDGKRKANLKGNKAGARNVIESKKTRTKNAKQNELNKRIGSQKAVALIIEDKPQQPMKKAPVLTPKAKIVKTETPKEIKLSPEKELALIENDPRLNDLLEQLDNEEKLSTADDDWVKKQMARHQKLMKKLGWLDDQGEEDLLQQFDDANSALDEFRN